MISAVVTINGFPYGPFHGTAIKENVYLPDWASALRVNYTLNLANILAGLLPEGELLKFKDLSEALTKDHVGEWRVHFHVPLTWFGEAISSTVNLIEDIFFKRVYLIRQKTFRGRNLFLWGFNRSPKTNYRFYLI